MIIREPAEKDRRIMMIHLTDKGRKVAQRIAEGHNIALFAKLDQEEQEQFTHILHKLNEMIPDELPADKQSASFYDDPQKHIETLRKLQQISDSTSNDPFVPTERVHQDHKDEP